MRNWIENYKGYKYTEAKLKLTSQKYEGKTNSSSFQSIYTSLLTNKIILKELNKKEEKENEFLNVEQSG
jgi:hypothetical protein